MLTKTRHTPRSLLLGPVIFTLIALAVPAFGAGDNCLAVNGVAGRPTSSIVSAGFTPVTTPAGTVFTYTFGSVDQSPSGGVPGLISYCVYPDLGFLPTGGILVDPSATGANGALFVAKMAAKGSFSFDRANGDPSNIPLDGSSRTMGTATWNTGCVTDPVTFVTECTKPSTQTILLHINDPAECDALYGTTGSTTCWVFPSGGAACEPGNPVCSPPVCNGEPACKSAVIDEATGAFDGNGYPIVPLKTLLHIHYAYVIVNQPGSGINMTFNPPILTGKNATKDINSGGGKDYFGCEQTPDPSGSPGGFTTIANYQSTGFQFRFFPSSGNNCPQSRFQLTAPQSGPIVLGDGQSVIFTVDMITRTNKGGKQEYTSPGPHLLNSGFTIKWFQDGPSAACPNWVKPTTLCSFSTGINPLYVDAQP